MTNQNDPQFLTTGQAARCLGISRHTVLRAVRRGEIRPAFKTPGGRLRFRPADIETLAETLAHSPSVEGKATPAGEAIPGPYDAYVEAFFQVPAPVSLAALDGEWLLVNPAFCALLGYTQEDLLAMGSPRLTHPKDVANAHEAEEALIAGHRLAARFQKRFRCSNGLYVWADVTISLVSDQQGRPLYFVNQMQDITDQKLAEEARRASEELLRSVVTTAPLALLAIDRLGTITLTEGSALHTLGLDPLDVVGRTIEEVFPPRSDFLALARRALAGESVASVITIGGAVLDSRWSPLRDNEGQFLGAISISTDITIQKLAEEVLIAREARFRALTDDAYDLICILGASGRVQYESPSYARLLGCPLAETQDDDPYAAIHAEDRDAVRAAIDQLVERQERQIRLQFRHQGTDGAWHTLDSVIVNRLDDPAVQGIVATSRDISDHMAIMSALAASENRARTLIENAPIGACIIDADGNFEIVNATYAEIYGFTPEQLLGRPSQMVKDEAAERQLSKNSSESLFAGDRRATTEELELVTRHGVCRIVSTTTFDLIGAGGRPRWACFVMDVTDQKKHEERLAHEAHHDTLTGLPNRALFSDRLEHALHVATRERASIAVFQIDLDHFKAINDRYGHAAGDEVLKTVAQRISRVLRVSDTVARLGGDEFAIILPHADEAGALQVAGKICAAVQPPIPVAGTTVSVGASVGMSLFPEHAADSVTLMLYADQAMYLAKARQCGAVVHSVVRTASEAPSLAAEQRDAIKNGQMQIWYQPIINCREDRTTRMEALVRWQHPILGLIEPADFIPVAEQVGAIDALTVWMLEDVLRHMRAWQRGGMPVDVSVNISMDVLLDQHFPDLIDVLLRQYDVEAERLILEISEAALMRNAEMATPAILRLAAGGVRLVLDGMGARHTSVELVSSLPLSELKVDRTVVGRLHAAHGPAMVGAILGLSKGLGLGLVADGVEDRRAWELLRSLGCNLMQGSYLCQPLADDEVVPWLRAEEEAMIRLSR